MQIKLHIETDQEVLKDVMVENNENDFYKEIGSVLPDLKTDLPQTLYVTSDLGSTWGNEEHIRKMELIILPCM